MPRKILPHAAILLCNMYIVFFVIDRFNTAMQFIDNDITKTLLLILCIISTVNSSFLIRDERRRQALRNRRAAQVARQRAPQSRPAGAAARGSGADRTARPRSTRIP